MYEETRVNPGSQDMLSLFCSISNVIQAKMDLRSNDTHAAGVTKATPRGLCEGGPRPCRSIDLRLDSFKLVQARLLVKRALKT
jgi:hypothetical protein